MKTPRKTIRLGSVPRGLHKQRNHVGFQQAVPFPQRQLVGSGFLPVLRLFQTDGGLSFIGDVETAAAEGGNRVEETAAA